MSFIPKNLEELQHILEVELDTAQRALLMRVDEMVSFSARSLNQIGKGGVPTAGNFANCAANIEAMVARVNKAKADLELFRQVQLMTLDSVTV